MTSSQNDKRILSPERERVSIHGEASGGGLGFSPELTHSGETSLRDVSGEKAVPLFADKYRILGSLGRGGMADVYLAVAPGLGGFNKLVVVKKLRDSFTEEPELVESFLNEAKLAARINHANIVQTFEVLASDERYFIVMEYLEGQPLNRLLRVLKSQDRRIPLNLSLRILSEALGGLHHAHELCDFDGTFLSVIHRDVSPQNIFITYTGEVKLLDFGIAKAALNSSQTQDGMMKGKVRYMAPEQASQDTIDRRVDIYAAGVVLWEAATGKRLMPTNAVECLQKLLFEELPGARSINPEIPEAVDEIISKAMVKDRTVRYPTALAFQDDIETYLRSTGEFVRTSDLGNLMQEVFEEERLRRKEQIQKYMANLSSGMEPTGFNSRTDNLIIGTGSGSFSHATVEAPQTNKNAKTYLALSAAAIVLLGGTAIWWTTSKSDSDVIVTPTPSSEPAVSSSQPKEETVTFAVRAEPSNATILLDGNPLPKNPHSMQVPADGAIHWVVVRAEGFKEEAKSVRFDQELILEFNLSPIVDEDDSEETKPRRGGPAYGRYHPPKEKAGETDPKEAAEPSSTKPSTPFPELETNPWEKRVRKGSSSLEENPWD